MFGEDIESDLTLLDVKIKQLKNEYGQYFSGNRPREPQILRAEVQKMFAYYSNAPIRNTGHRFRFGSLQARFFSLRRQWDVTVRKIEDGTYERHLFKADLHHRERATAKPVPRPTGSARPQAGSDLFQQYLEARQSCGQGTSGVTRKKLDGLLQKQKDAIRTRYGCAEVRFRVVVEQGRAKLRATPVKD